MRNARTKVWNRTTSTFCGEQFAWYNLRRLFDCSKPPISKRQIYRFAEFQILDRQLNSMRETFEVCENYSILTSFTDRLCTTGSVVPPLLNHLQDSFSRFRNSLMNGLCLPPDDGLAGHFVDGEHLMSISKKNSIRLSVNNLERISKRPWNGGIYCRQKHRTADCKPLFAAKSMELGNLRKNVVGWIGCDTSEKNKKESDPFKSGEQIKLMIWKLFSWFTLE